MYTFRKKHPITPGFTLIEILVVIGMLGILASAVLVAVNPLKQFAQARNAKRVSDVNAILNAISDRIADNGGVYDNSAVTGTNCGPDILQIPHTMTMSNTGETDNVDVRPCLVPNYIPEMPVDPSAGSNSCKNDSCAPGTYKTGYTVSVTDSHRITVCAPQSKVDGMADPYCLTR